MGLLRKHYWPKIDEESIRVIEALRKETDFKCNEDIYNKMIDLGYVACHRTHYRPWKRFTDYINDRSPFESRRIVRNNIKSIFFKLAYGRSAEMVAKDYIIRKFK